MCPCINVSYCKKSFFFIMKLIFSVYSPDFATIDLFLKKSTIWYIFPKLNLDFLTFYSFSTYIKVPSIGAFKPTIVGLSKTNVFHHYFGCSSIPNIPYNLQVWHYNTCGTYVEYLEMLCSYKLFFLFILLNVINMFYPWVVKYINNLFQFLCILYKTFINLLRNVLSRLLNLTYTSNRNTSYLLLFFAFSRLFAFANATNNLNDFYTSVGIHNQQVAHYVLACLGSIVYIMLGSLVDYYMISRNLRNRYINRRYRIILGILYCIFIHVGIFATNSIHYLALHHYSIPTGVLIGVGFILSLIFTAWWYIIGRPPVDPGNDFFNSLWRSFIEFWSFVGIVELTFGIWSALAVYPNFNQISAGVFGIFFLFSSFILFYLEGRRRYINRIRNRNLLDVVQNNIIGIHISSFLLAFVYTINWSCMVGLTNPMLNAYFTTVNNLPYNWLIHLIVLLLCMLMTSLTPPNYYHFSNDPLPFVWSEVWRIFLDRNLILRFLAWLILTVSYVLSAAILYYPLAPQ